MKTWWLSAVFAPVLALAMPHPLLGADGNFQTALTQAYIHNFNLHIARSQLSATDEKVALAARRLTASAVAMGGKAVFNEWPYSSRAAPDPKEVFRYDQTAGPGVTWLKLVLLLCGLWVAAPPAVGDSLARALTNSYQTHRGLRAAQVQAVAAREGIVQAEAGQLPSLQVFGYGGYYNDYSLDEEPFGIGLLPDVSHYGVYRWGLSLELPLYKGGAIRAGIRKAQADAAAQEAALAPIRQDLFLNAATAYLDLFKAHADLAVLQTSIQAYKVQKEAVVSLLAQQDATLVDLDQTVSKLEDTQAQAYEAHIQEAKAVADYRRWIGEDPGGLIQPDPPKNLPESRAAAIRLALNAHPAVRQAVRRTKPAVRCGGGGHCPRRRQTCAGAGGQVFRRAGPLRGGTRVGNRTIASGCSSRCRSTERFLIDVFAAIDAEGPYADATIHCDGRWWWLFAQRGLDELCLFMAESPLGPWRPHPASPMWPGNRARTRPGGRLQVHQGRLIRFAQDAWPSYGSCLRAYHVQRLDPQRYQEQELAESPVLSAARTGWNAVAMHHLDAIPLDDGQWLAAVDGATFGQY
jgi:hypothetical protein